MNFYLAISPSALYTYVQYKSGVDKTLHSHHLLTLQNMQFHSAEIENRNSVWITPNLTVSLPRVPYGTKYYYMLNIWTDLSFESVKS